MNEILVEPHRLRNDLFGYKQGDINAAYSCDVFPKIRTPFLHEGTMYTVGSAVHALGKTMDIYMVAHPLIPAEEYEGPGEKPRCNEGKLVTYRDKSYRLGEAVRFLSRPQTVDERVELMRRMFAYGGYFAAERTYHELLRRWQLTFEDPVFQQAIAQELARPDFKTQQEMCDWLENKINKTSQHPVQLDLF